jgi:hypothetical protein
MLGAGGALSLAELVVASAAEMRARWEAEEATPAADVYSFGILLAEMQTKADIYSNYAPHRVVHGVSAGALRPKLPPLMPPALVALAKDCWSGVPTFRLTAREVVERLHEPHLARPPSEEEMEADLVSFKGSAEHWWIHQALDLRTTSVVGVAHQQNPSALEYA